MVCAGNSLLRAKAALMAGLQNTLRLKDRFTVAAFNEGQQWWQGEWQQADIAVRPGPGPNSRHKAVCVCAQSKPVHVWSFTSPLHSPIWVVFSSAQTHHRA